MRVRSAIPDFARMPGTRAAVLALALAGAILTTSQRDADSMSNYPFAPDRGDPPRARPGHEAIREEYDAALSAGTRAALLLFIERHPGNPLARDAQRQLERLPPG